MCNIFFHFTEVNIHERNVCFYIENTLYYGADSTCNNFEDYSCYIITQQIN